MTDKQRWLVVVLYAAAMAYVEAAVVLYLRTMVNRLDPYQLPPVDLSEDLIHIEMIREATTLIMLAAVGWLAGRTWRSRLGYTLVAFGVWDILYYVFLVPLSGWPRSLLDWDILFLLPLPWWGPVLAPVSIAALMVVGGTVVGLLDRPERALWPGPWARRLTLVGVALALYVFMADSIRALGGGAEAVRQVLPTRFNWPVFVVAVLLLAAPIVDLCRQQWDRRLTAEADSGRLDGPRGRGRSADP
jgi:hypothetical protein